MMMSEPVETYEQDGYTVKLFYDDQIEDPRTTWSHAATMVCSHRHYCLGDEQATWDEWVAEQLDRYFPEEMVHHYYLANSDNPSDWTKADAYYKRLIARLDEVMEIMPLYLYEHSGITISTTPFYYVGDSGQVGVIYMTREQILARFGGKLLTEKKRRQARALMMDEVDEYNQYLTGDVYGYIVTDPNENEVDSCWGLFGYEWARAEAKAALEHAARKGA